MGQAHGSGAFFHHAQVKEMFAPLQPQWGEPELANLGERLKDMTLNFSLDRAKFAKLLQLSVSFEAHVGRWFTEFSHDRASQVVDGLEFLSAAILASSNVPFSRKILLVFSLFDLDRTGGIRKDEFTILLKALTTGLHRMVSGLPPPASVIELGGLSAEVFAALGKPFLAPEDLLQWSTEARFSLHYASVLSRLGESAAFAWGANRRLQLGLDMQPPLQRVPCPVLGLEGLQVQSVATGESHTLLLTSAGAVWSCGSGFCGILGHGDCENASTPRQVEALAHVNVVDVAVGVRHCAAISDKGQVFTWGAADMGQLGHGPTDDQEVHEAAFDPRSGGQFSFVSRPTVVMALFGKRVFAVGAGCCNFSTAILTDAGRVYTWGNNTDGQCGQGQKCPDHKTVFVDPHMQRTAMQVLDVPRLLDGGGIEFQRVVGGGYHMLAIDKDSKLWSWGRGQWGPLGHGDQRTVFEPKLVEALRHQVCNDVAGGEAHSACLASLYRLTVTTGTAEVDLAPFSLLGLPLGRVDLQLAARSEITPPNTSLLLNAFTSAPLRQVSTPLALAPGQSVVDVTDHPPEKVRESVVLMDRSLWPGDWLRLQSIDFDFCLQVSTCGAAVPPGGALAAPLLWLAESRWEWADCSEKLCVFEWQQELGSRQTPEDLSAVFIERAAQCQQAGGAACVFVLPPGAQLFDVQVPAEGGPEAAAAAHVPLAVLSHEHGQVLKKHVTKLVNMRVAESPGGVPDEVRPWQECREDFTGRVYYENMSTGERRWAPPQVNPNTEACLVVIEEDTFQQRLAAVLDSCPKGVVVCQQSWRPDVEAVVFSADLLERAGSAPVAFVTYEGGEELKGVLASGAQPWVSMEVQSFGGVFAWGSGTKGQLGLSGMENRTLLSSAQNALTGETNRYVSRPTYVAHLHEHQVTSIACGAAHMAAVTLQGEAFTWGSLDAVGAAVGPDKPSCEVPTFVEQLEGLVRCSRVFAGNHHSFVVGAMPYKTVLD